MIKIDNLAIVALFVVSILISGIQEASASSNQTQNYSKYLETNKLIGTMPGFQDPAGFGYDSTNGNIYVGNHGSNYVSAVWISSVDNTFRLKGPKFSLPQMISVEYPNHLPQDS